MQPLFNAFILSAHLILVSVASGVPLVVCWTIWRPKGSFELSLCGPILKMSLWSLIVGALFGVGYGTLVWDGTLAKSLEVTGSRLTFAIIEFLFSLSIIGLAWWRVDRSGYSPGKFERGLVTFGLVAAATNLLYHFPIFFGVIEELKAQVDNASTTLSSGEFREIAFSTKVLYPALHFLYAIGIISAHAAIVCALNRDIPKDAPSRFIRWLLGISMAAALLQIPLGLASIDAMPRLEQIAITANDWEATTIFLAAVIAVLILPVFQIIQWRQPTNFHNARWMLVWTGIIYWLMTLTSVLAKEAAG